jgi:hypothetical protein
MEWIGKKNLNGNVYDCKHCDVKHTFKVCSGRCNIHHEEIKIPSGDSFFKEGNYSSNLPKGNDFLKRKAFQAVYLMEMTFLNK